MESDLPLRTVPTNGWQNFPLYVEAPEKNAGFHSMAKLPIASASVILDITLLYILNEPIILHSQRAPGKRAQPQWKKAVSLCSMSRNQFQLIPSQLGLPASLPPLDENHQWGLYDFAN